MQVGKYKNLQLKIKGSFISLLLGFGSGLNLRKQVHSVLQCLGGKTNLRKQIFSPLFVTSFCEEKSQALKLY
jgi:hypothetical protein